MCKIHRIFFSPSEQDQAILHYRVGWCLTAPVVRDRLIANGSGLGDPHLQRGSIDIKVLTDLFSVLLLRIYRH